LHQRFGRLRLETLFGPAIWIAGNGVAVSAGYWIGIQIDRQRGRLTAGLTSQMNARAEGY
jgi:gamma-glutamyltranspeptidase